MAIVIDEDSWAVFGSEDTLKWTYSVVGLGRVRGNIYPPKPIIVMEKGEKSLLDYLQNKIVDMNNRLIMIKQIANGISYIHNQGYIHRDLKVLIMIWIFNSLLIFLGVKMVMWKFVIMVLIVIILNYLNNYLVLVHIVSKIIDDDS